MHIFHLDAQIIAAGKKALRGYMAAVLCGPEALAYIPGISRNTGLSMVPGVIVGLIEAGMTTRDELLNGAARATLCRRSTIATFLDALSGEDPARHLWGRTGVHYHLLAVEGERGVVTLLAA